MPTKRIAGELEGHTLSVVNTWFGGMKFYHNENLIEHNKDKLAIDKNKAVISHSVTMNEVEKLVEVYVQAIVRVKIQIKVDGVKIAGDDF